MPAGSYRAGFLKESEVFKITNNPHSVNNHCTPMTTFKDHFSGHSPEYRKYRPDYPDQLYEFLSDLSQEHVKAWDAGTGNGQCAIKLARHFNQVLATDPSANQIKAAVPHDRVTYHVSRAESCPATDQSFDLVAVAQALHWFDFPLFFSEVKRVLKPKGILAIWTYTLANISPEVDAVTEEFYTEIVGKYWPPERRYVEAKYQNVPIPFVEEIVVPQFRITLNYDMNDYLAYLRTWSAVKNYIKDHRTDPVGIIQQKMEAAWGTIEKKKEVTWPVYLRVGYM